MCVPRMCSQPCWPMTVLNHTHSQVRWQLWWVSSTGMSDNTGARRATWPCSADNNVSLNIENTTPACSSNYQLFISEEGGHQVPGCGRHRGPFLACQQHITMLGSASTTSKNWGELAQLTATTTWLCPGQQAQSDSTTKKEFLAFFSGIMKLQTAATENLFLMKKLLY